MHLCKKCSNPILSWTKINGKFKNTSNRKYCLDCSPYGLHNTRKIHIDPKERTRIDKSHERQKQLRKSRKEKLVNLHGGKCIICCYSKCIRNMEFHHVDPKTKTFELSQRRLASTSWMKILEESKKTVLLCGNCHGEVHEGLHLELEIQWLSNIKNNMVVVV